MAELLAFFTNNGVPVTGPAGNDIPEIIVRQVDGTLEQAATDMTEIGEGWYRFTFATADGVEYVWRADGDPDTTGQTTAVERYVRGAISGTTVARSETDVPAILADTAAMEPVVTLNLDARVSDVEADTQDIQSRLPAALVGGRMNSDVGNMQAGTVDAVAIATDAIDADALATDGLQEIADHLETNGTNPHGTGAWDAVSAITPQAVRDAMKLAPTVGAPAAGSVDEHLDDILADTAAIEPLVTANLDATISSRETETDAATRAAADATAHALTQSTGGPGPWTTAAAGPTASDIADAVWSRSVADGEFAFPAAGRVLNRIFRYGTLPRRNNYATQKLEIGSDATFGTIVQSWDIETDTGPSQPVIDQFGSPSVRLDPDLAF